MHTKMKFILLTPLLLLALVLFSGGTTVLVQGTPTIAAMTAHRVVAVKS